MDEISLFLLTLVLTYETCLKDTRSDPQLELILFNLVIVEGYNTIALAFLLLNVVTEGAYTRIIFIKSEAVLLSGLVSSYVVRGKAPGKLI